MTRFAMYWMCTLSKHKVITVGKPKDVQPTIDDAGGGHTFSKKEDNVVYSSVYLLVHRPATDFTLKASNNVARKFEEESSVAQVIVYSLFDDMY